MSTLVEDFSSIVLNELPLLDVRAPIEFEKGAFINAINIPIMNDEERRLIGIKYKEKGNEAAVDLGKKLIAGEPQKQRVQEWMAFIKKNPTAYLYCFRGGQRSAITQMWLEESGIKIPRLKGGYKQFRNFLMNRSLEISSKLDTLILGGRTGSGKTILLKDIKNSIDLEALANHRGSSFGNFIESQPSQINFENNLAYKLIQFNSKEYKNLIIEHESHNIGKNFIPKDIYENFMKGKLILLETPLEKRVDITYEEYVTVALSKYEEKFEEDGLEKWANDVQNSLNKIKKRLGSELHLELSTIFKDAYAIHNTKESEILYKKWIELLLTKYYDPMYDYQIQKSDLEIIFRGNDKEVLSFVSDSYMDKFNKAIENTFFNKLPKKEQQFITKKALIYKFSHQELKQIIDIARDLEMWNEKTIIEIFPEHTQKKVVFSRLRKIYEEIRNTPNSYNNFTLKNIPKEQKFNFKVADKDGFGLGLCPVASEKTRCCNLLTLDAVESCGFDCSYCSIQSFYNQNTITFDSSFKDKLLNLNLDRNKTYHIGTGQASDSLMFGNKEGVLDALFEFAKKNPNVILEFKTKSDNIKYFLENEVPKNIFCTWSLNTPTIIKNEEHLTASLDKRINAARKMADKGVKVGFHFHPIVEYENYLDEYQEVYKRLLVNFQAKEVALVSFGTLTFIKPVIKQLREREFRTKTTQIPHVNASGKTSYPEETKIKMFKHAYESFSAWHQNKPKSEVFFYLCMEEHQMWKKTFSYQYATNNDFESAMLQSYCNKIEQNYLI